MVQLAGHLPLLLWDSAVTYGCEFEFWSHGMDFVFSFESVNY